MCYSSFMTTPQTPEERREAQIRNGPPTVDELANIIRKVDGQNKLGAGALAELIIEELSK